MNSYIDQIKYDSERRLVVNPTAVTVAHARAFLMEPDSAVEEKLIAALNDSIVLAGYAPFEESHIEWDCAEHGVIHWFVGQDRCIEFDPDGFIEML